MARQAGVPEPHEIAYVLQGLVPLQAEPAAQALQVPAWHTWSVPQLAPSLTTVPVSWQAGAPVAQEFVPAWQGLDGVQAVPAVQALHEPPLQTRFVPQLVPFATATCVSEQTAAPVLQVMEPA